MIIKIIEPSRQNTRYDVRSLTPNPGPIVIATLLKQQGHDVEVISEYITRLNLQDLSRADLVGISITTYNAQRGYAIAHELTTPVVFGGMHASKFGSGDITGMLSLDFWSHLKKVTSKWSPPEQSNWMS